jgi:hypothetical protein
VGEDFDFNLLTQENRPSKGQPLEKQKRGEEKTEIQARYTRKALKRLLETKQN